MCAVGDWPATDPASDALADREVIAASRLVLDALPRAITVLDGDGMIVGWNQVSEHSYGWTSAEAVGRSMYELMTPPDLRVLARSIVETVLKGESWSGPVTVVLRDGTTRSTSSFLSPLRSLHGDIIGVGCAADDAAGDDDVRRLEKQADVLSEHLLLAIEAGRLGTWQWTKATGVTVWNVQMERLFGLEPSTFDGTYDAWVALLHPDDVHHSIGVLDQAVADQGSYAVEHRVVWPDGSEHWLQRPVSTMPRARRSESVTVVDRVRRVGEIASTRATCRS